METILSLFALIWLGIVSWFDLRTREIPHSAWVIVPLAVAAIYRIAYRDYGLVVLTLMICCISERERLGKVSGNPRLASCCIWLPLVVVSFFRAASISPLGAVAIVAFWLAWELRCWGGADAVASITLALLWPDMPLMLALLTVHLAAALGTTLVTWLRERQWRLHAIPGLPLLLLAVMVRESLVRLAIQVG